MLLSLVLALFWLLAVGMGGGYDCRFIGVGTDEFRRVLNAGICLTAGVALLAYATKTDIARGYVVIALPAVTLLDLLAMFTLRKRLHKLRRLGSCMRKVVVVGHAESSRTWLSCCGARVMTDCPSSRPASPEPPIRRATSSKFRRSAAWTQLPAS